MFLVMVLKCTVSTLTGVLTLFSWDLRRLRITYLMIRGLYFSKMLEETFDAVGSVQDGHLG